MRIFQIPTCAIKLPPALNLPTAFLCTGPAPLAGMWDSGGEVLDVMQQLHFSVSLPVHTILRIETSLFSRYKKAIGEFILVVLQKQNIDNSYHSGLGWYRSILLLYHLVCPSAHDTLFSPLVLATVSNLRL